MSKQSLAVKYRPQRFEDVVEQDVVKSILGEQLKDKSFKNCLLFCGGAGTGKAQPLWSKVLTPNGFITMKEVEVGTEIVTGNGNIAKVTEIYPNQERPIYCITLGNRTMFHVADNHLNVIIIDNEEKVVNTLELIDLLEKEEITHKPIFMYIYDDANKSKTTTRVISVSLIEPKEECKCIYVDAEEHTYITDNYVVTHNTTSARIFANEINDFKGHVIEIDAASNNSVEHMRKIIEEARTQSLDSEYKVFVLDEVHMLSNAAWNAALKLIEEPPKKAVFIFATTDPQKIPATIISRVQRYQFQKISYEGIVSRLKYIIGEENKENENNITFEDSALEYIAKQADGGMRDAITLLDKAIGYSQELTIQNVLTALGSVSYETMFKLSTALDKMDATTVIDVIEEVHGSGMDLKQFMKNYNYFVLDLCKYKLFRNFKYLQIPSIYEKFINQYDDNSFAFFNTLLNELLKLNDKLKWETLPKPLVESTLLNLCSEA